MQCREYVGHKFNAWVLGFRVYMYKALGIPVWGEHVLFCEVVYIISEVLQMEYYSTEA